MDGEGAYPVTDTRMLVPGSRIARVWPVLLFRMGTLGTASTCIDDGEDWTTGAKDGVTSLGGFPLGLTCAASGNGGVTTPAGAGLDAAGAAGRGACSALRGPG